jgi:hypothetical protein
LAFGGVDQLGRVVQRARLQLRPTRAPAYFPLRCQVAAIGALDPPIGIVLLEVADAMPPATFRQLKARRAGLDLSVRALLAELAGISETVLLYPGDRGRPKAHRMLTDTTPVQDKLAKIFALDRHLPRR